MLKSLKGASLVEYGILVGLIAVVAIAAVQALGVKINDVFEGINNTLNASDL